MDFGEISGPESASAPEGNYIRLLAGATKAASSINAGVVGVVFFREGGLCSAPAGDRPYPIRATLVGVS